MVPAVALLIASVEVDSECACMCVYMHDYACMYVHVSIFLTLWHQSERCIPTARSTSPDYLVCSVAPFIIVALAYLARSVALAYLALLLSSAR